MGVPLVLVLLFNTHPLSSKDKSFSQTRHNAPQTPALLRHLLCLQSSAKTEETKGDKLQRALLTSPAFRFYSASTFIPDLSLSFI